MTQKDFETLLRTKDILWNDIVSLTVYNPHYKGENKWWQFRRDKTPKTIDIQGALGYHYGDENVNLCVEKGRMETQNIYFTFNEIMDINRIKR